MLLYHSVLDIWNIHDWCFETVERFHILALGSHFRSFTHREHRFLLRLIVYKSHAYNLFAPMHAHMPFAHLPSQAFMCCSLELDIGLHTAAHHMIFSSKQLLSAGNQCICFFSTKTSFKGLLNDALFILHVLAGYRALFEMESFRKY